MTLTNTISCVKEGRLKALCFHLFGEVQKQAKLIWGEEVRKIVMGGWVMIGEGQGDSVVLIMFYFLFWVCLLLENRLSYTYDLCTFL